MASVLRMRILFTFTTAHAQDLGLPPPPARNRARGTGQMEEGGRPSVRRLAVLRGHLATGERAIKAVQCAGSSSSAPMSSSKDEKQRAFPRKRLVYY